MKQEEKTARTREKIYAAAIREFGTYGYSAGSVNHICSTGINKGLIYHNFKDKDALYLACVRKSCQELIRYVTEHMKRPGFVEYMEARMGFFAAHEMEAYLFLEARSSPAAHLQEQLEEICADVDALNISVFEQELEGLELRSGVSREDALNYFLEIQKIFNLDFFRGQHRDLPQQEQVLLHEKTIVKVLDLLLYGIAKGERPE